jgi:hypothetical protein
VRLADGGDACGVPDARIYGDVAVVVAHGSNQGQWQGCPFEADEWVTEVFGCRDDGWRCAVSALTPRLRGPINARS